MLSDGGYSGRACRSQVSLLGGSYTMCVED